MLVGKIPAKQHTTVSTSTGKTAVALIRLQPHETERMASDCRAEKSLRGVAVAQSILACNFKGNPAWMERTRTKGLGHGSWMIKCKNGAVRQKLDHIKPGTQKYQTEKPSSASCPVIFFCLSFALLSSIIEDPSSGDMYKEPVTTPNTLYWFLMFYSHHRIPPPCPGMVDKLRTNIKETHPHVQTRVLEHLPKKETTQLQQQLRCQDPNEKGDSI